MQNLRLDAVRIWRAVFAVCLPAHIVFAHASNVANQIDLEFYGLSAILKRWLSDLELREEIGIVADDLLNFHGWDVDGDNDPEMAKEIWRRYPGY